MSDYHTVQQGECLSSIARKYGFSDFLLIYNHPENAELKSRRRNPNIIYPGDTLFIPDREPREVSCATEQRHRFRLKRMPVKLRLCVQDDQNQPYVNTKYRLRVGTRTYEGLTDGEGRLEEVIPHNETEGELTIWPLDDYLEDSCYTFSLGIGELNPIEEISGVKARLKNLGFDCTVVDEHVDETTRESLRAFQDRYGLTPTGELDEGTRSELRRVHDGE